MIVRLECTTIEIFLTMLKLSRYQVVLHEVLFVKKKVFILYALPINEYVISPGI